MIERWYLSYFLLYNTNHMHHIWHWLSDFMGLNFGQDAFSTHMYNFWSGFGGDITEFALIGTLIALYRHHSKYIRAINPLNLVRKKNKTDE